MDDIERRKLIRSINEETGFYSIRDLQAKLKSTCSLDVSVEVLEEDLRQVELFDKGEINLFVNKLLANCNAHMDNLNTMSVKAKYEHYRIKAIDSYFRNVSFLLRYLHPKKKTDAVSVPAVGDVEENEGDDGVDFKFG